MTVVPTAASFDLRLGPLGSPVIDDRSIAFVATITNASAATVEIAAGSPIYFQVTRATWNGHLLTPTPAERDELIERGVVKTTWIRLPPGQSVHTTISLSARPAAGAPQRYRYPVRPGRWVVDFEYQHLAERHHPRQFVGVLTSPGVKFNVR